MIRPTIIPDADRLTLTPAPEEPFEAEAEPLPEEDPRPAPGRLVGPFHLVRRLGRGGSAEVWEAVDRRYDAPVALKLFHSADASDVDRAVAEAAAMSRVSHDNVVAVREAGRLDSGWYLAMALYREQVPGDDVPRVAQDLGQVPPRSPEEVARWGVQLARALAAAHAAGVYHQDVKPENVLCLPQSRTVRLGDFGLAPPAGAERAPRESRRWEAAGLWCAGTPELMAPEQARGLPRRPDPRRDQAWLVAVDVYGLGATLWTLLADRAPHAPPASLRHEDIVAAATEPVPRVDEVAMRWKVPVRLAKIVARAMAPDPLDRHPSAAALAEELQRWLDHEPLRFDADFAPVRAALWVRRHPLRTGSVAMATMLLLGGGAVVLLGERIATRQAELAAVEARLAETDAERARAEAELDRTRGRAQRVEAALGAAQEEIGDKAAAIGDLERRVEQTRASAASALAAAEARGDEAEAHKLAVSELLGAALDDAQAQQRRATAEALRAARAEEERDAARQRAEAADKARADAEKTKAEAERAWAEAERARAEADQARQAAERARAAAEAALAEAEAGAAVRIAPR